MISNMSWGIGTLFDKYVTSNRIGHPMVYQLFIVLLGAPALLIIPFVDFVIPPLHIIGIIFLSEFIAFFGNILYLRSVRDEDVTRINMLWSLVPIFTLIIAWFTIDQKLPPTQLTAFGLLLIGAILASIHIVKGKKLRLSKVILSMAGACLAFAIAAVILSYLTNQLSFFNIFIWTYIAAIPITIAPFLNKNLRKELKKALPLLNKKTAALIFTATNLGNIGFIFNIWAISLGPVALVFSLEGFQMLFVFAITILISFFTSIRLHEELDRKNLILKGAALLVVVSGITTLYLN